MIRAPLDGMVALENTWRKVRWDRRRRATRCGRACPSCASSIPSTMVVRATIDEPDFAWVCRATKARALPRRLPGDVFERICSRRAPSPPPESTRRSVISPRLFRVRAAEPPDCCPTSRRLSRLARRAPARKLARAAPRTKVSRSRRRRWMASGWRCLRRLAGRGRCGADPAPPGAAKISRNLAHGHGAQGRVPGHRHLPRRTGGRPLGPDHRARQRAQPADRLDGAPVAP